MQYQILLKAIKEAIADNNITRLLDLTSKDWVMIYLYTDKIFLNSYTVEMEYFNLYKNANDEIFNLSFDLLSSSAYCGTNFDEGKTQRTFQLAYKNGLGESRMWPLFFYRTHYQGGKLCKNYELLQNFVHINGIFFNDNNGTYSLINEDGDTEVKVVTIFESGLNLILFERNALDFYLGSANNFLLRLFHMDELQEDHNREIESLNTSYITRKIFLEKEQIWGKGTEIILPLRTIKQIEKGESKKYESFLIDDLKHDQTLDCSCDPKELDNYFKDTGKPWDISPAFFKPEVLSKYRNDPDKYEVSDRSIKCKGAWTLKTYSINTEGQVHTYLRYLGQLPYKEQKYWRTYNEERKAEISYTAFKTDFLGEWYEEITPLNEIKKHLANFPLYIVNNKAHILWEPKGGDIDVLFNQIHPVITDIKKEYKDYLLNLAILLVDGFPVKTLRNIVGADKNTNSLTCLEILLNNWKSENTKAILKAMRDLQTERSSLVAHGGGKIDYDVKEAALTLTTRLSKVVALLVEEIRRNSE